MSFIYKLFLIIFNIKCGKNLKIHGLPLLFQKKGSSIIMGDNITINSSVFSNLVGLYQRSIIITRVPNSKITIGNNVGMSGCTIYARKSIEIGDNTLIGGNVKILDNDFHPLEIDDRNNDVKEKIKSKPIKIGNNCFIGVNSIILKGTELGDGCIVGAGAVVAGKFPPNSVIVGNPGKILKRK